MTVNVPQRWAPVVSGGRKFCLCSQSQKQFF